jgi:hypothetical protein
VTRVSLSLVAINHHSVVALYRYLQTAGDGGVFGYVDFSNHFITRTSNQITVTHGCMVAIADMESTQLKLINC